MTSFAEALDFHWDHSLEELAWHGHFRSQPLMDRCTKIIHDYIVYFFAYLLDVHDFSLVAKKNLKNPIGYPEYVLRNSLCEIRKSRCIVVLNGHEDLPAHPAVFEQLKTQMKAEIVVWKILDFEHLDEKLQSLRSLGNTIEALWIRAHGTPFTITFGPGLHGTIDVTPYTQELGKHPDDEDFAAELGFREQQECVADKANSPFTRALAHLASKAPIILESCSTGSQAFKTTNIQHYISQAAKGHPVFAPDRETLPLEKDSFSQDAKGSLSVNFQGFKQGKTFAPDSLLGRLEAVWHA